MKKNTKRFICFVFFIFYSLFFSLGVKAQLTVVIAQPTTTTICAGSSITLKANASGGGPYNYSWSPSSGLNCTTCSTTTATPTATTTYTITVTSNTVTATASITITVIPKPTVAISSSTTSSICPGRLVTLNASGGNTYTWSTSPVQTTKSIVVSPTTSTSYSVFVTNSSGCSNSASVTVTVAPSPKDSLTSTYTSICTGILNNTTLAAASTDAISYSWSTGATTSSIQIGPLFSTSSSTYTVVVTNANGCTRADSIHINVTANPYSAPSINPGSYNYCLGDNIQPITVSYTAPYIAWFNSSLAFLSVNNPYQPANVVLGTNTYYVVQGTLGCLSPWAIVYVILNPLPVANAGTDITICSGHTAHLHATGGGKYLWTPATHLSDTAVADPAATPDSTISYQVIVTDTNKCRAKDSVTVYVDVNDSCGLHIYNVITPNGDDRNDVWWIDGINSFPDNTVTIFNRWGDVVWRGSKYDNKKIVWHGQNEKDQPLPAGTYYYVLDLKGKILSGWVELIR
ncbi:MAG: gliding motility-associated C-terminal domain-containing protein [Bacteroidia bacterium]